MFEKYKGQALFEQMFGRKDITSSYKMVSESNPLYQFFKTVNDHYQAMKEMNHEIMEIKNESGLTLKALYIDNEKEDTCICFHDYCVNGFKEFAIEANYFHEMNMNILIPLSRAYGQSEGFYNGFGDSEIKDALLWIKKIEKKNPDGKILVHGIGMGGLLCTSLASLKWENKIAFLIESPIESNKVYLDQWMEMLFQKNHNKEKILQSCMNKYEEIFHTPFQTIEAAKAMENIINPTLLIFDEEKSGDEMKEQTFSNPNIEVIKLEKCNRANAFFVHKQEYEKMIEKMLKKLEEKYEENK